LAKKKSTKISSLEVNVDVFESIKRAMIRRGFVRKRIPQDAIENPNPKQLVSAAMKAHEILFKTDSVFPFVLFPDTITLDREKLTIIKRSFFKVANISSSPIQDILSVEASLGPFFGSIHISSRYFLTNRQSVNFLSRKDTIQLQRLLQGYIIAHEQKIDCSKINKKRLVALLNELGKGGTN
jgi:hypothetical protein